MISTTGQGLYDAEIIIGPVVSARPAEMPRHGIPSAQMLPLMTEDMGKAVEVATFYAENASHQVLARDPLAIMNHLDDRTCTVFRICDPHGQPMLDGQSTNIVAAAMCHEYRLPVTEPGSGRCAVRTHFEFGTLRVRLNGFGFQSTLLWIRIIDMLARSESQIFPFANIFEENEPVSRRLITKGRFAIVANPPREMVALREEELRRSVIGLRPFLFLRPTMDTFIDCAVNLCSLVQEPVLERQASQRDTFASVACIKVGFSQHYPAKVFEAAQEIATARPGTLADLGRLLHGDPGYFADDFVA